MTEQIRKLRTASEFRQYVEGLGVELPFAAHAGEALAAGDRFVDASAGTFTMPNRFAVLPMEGWDGGRDGSVTDLVRRRWRRFGTSGAGLVWGEATAVVPEARANPNQLIAHPDHIDGLIGLRQSLASDQVAGLQLTHSGRWSRPDGQPAPRTAYRHPVLDDKVGGSDEAVLSDAELDRLVEQFVDAAGVAAAAGFDFVDIKHCHGYLAHELLSGHDRPGPYGGDFAGRTALLRNVVAGIRETQPGLAIAVRLSVYDFAPFVRDADGVGVPAADDQYRYAFGGDGTGVGISLDEPRRFLDLMAELGVGLVCVTAGSPYYNPHIQRPTYYPASDAYLPPEDPIVGAARLISATAELKASHPDMMIVGSGYSYLQQWLPNVAEAVVANGGADLVGLGRMVLSYPDLPADVLAGRDLNHRHICRTFSDCTTAPRNGMVSGCFPIDEFYKQHPDRAQLIEVKRTARKEMGGGRAR